MEGRCSRGCGLASIVSQLPYGRKNFSVTTEQLQRFSPEGQGNSRHDRLNAFLSHFSPLRCILYSRHASVELARQTRGLEKGIFLYSLC